MNGIKSVIALGMFDGVHLGHRALLKCAVQFAKEQGAKSAVFTFSNHPLELFQRDVRYLSTNEQRRSLFFEQGIENIEMIPFSEQIANLQPSEFVTLLKSKYDIAALIVGFNYSFGKMGAGNCQSLSALAREYGFEVKVIDPVKYEGESVSSSRIRTSLQNGEVAKAANMLCRYYSIGGVIVPNRHIGRKLGFPTANIEGKNMAIPRDGVYASYATIDGSRFCAVTNIGTNPTVNGTRRTIETHLIDAEGDYYGKRLEIEFVEYLRAECIFASAEALAEQIQRDIKKAKNLLKNQK